MPGNLHEAASAGEFERADSGRASMNNELRLHLIECSMKDARDLVHALMVNLGSVEVALTTPPVPSGAEYAWNLLRTCQQLTRLLAGAVQIARRDACSDAPKPRSVSLTELFGMIKERLSRKYEVHLHAWANDVSDISVYVDPDSASSALERLSDGACSLMAATPAILLASKYNGANLSLSLRWIDTSPDDEIALDEKAGQRSRETNFQLNRNYMEVISTCRALLARQGAELDVGFDDCGNLETAIVLPANRTPASQSGESTAIGTSLASDTVEASNPAEFDHDAGRKRSGSMIIQSDRFGSIDVDAQDTITFPRGIIGFADEHEFVLIRTRNANAIGWLQSANTPYMALPVVSAHVLMPKYPDVDIESYAETAGLGQSVEDLAVLVVLNAPPGIPATVNLVAPIIVNASTRKGAQVLLEGSHFTTREIFMLPARSDAKTNGEARPATNAAE